MAGMILESIATYAVLTHTFFMNEKMDSPAIFFKRSNRSNRHSIEIPMVIIRGLSGGYPSLRTIYERKKHNRVVPPITSW